MVGRGVAPACAAQLWDHGGETVAGACCGAAACRTWLTPRDRAASAGQVTGAASDADARVVAKSVAGSSLAKSAIFGGDPNWGRIAAAAGYSGAPARHAPAAAARGQRDALLRHPTPTPVALP